MEDTERNELRKKMDKDLQDFIEERIAANAANPKEDMFEKMTVDELAEELNNHPAFMKEYDPSKPMSPAMEALQAMKYESDSAADNAESFKEDGNHNFKLKKYRWAVDAYTEGIKCRAPCLDLNAILYTNRAAAQWHVGNYRSSYKDCIIARKFKPDHMKAIIRGVLCCIELKRFDSAIQWCDEGLQIKPDEPKLLEARPKADKLKRQHERDSRRNLMKERKKAEEEGRLLLAVRNRGVTLAGMKPSKDSSKLDPLMLSSLEAHHPGASKVYVDANGNLVWPVLFLYPEHTETDLITHFSDTNTLGDHIQAMFGPGVEPAPWDEEHKYTPEKIEVYFENKEKETLHKVKTNIPLAEVLRDKKYVVEGGTPGFFIIAKDSKFHKVFLERYNLSQ